MADNSTPNDYYNFQATEQIDIINKYNAYKKFGEGMDPIVKGIPFLFFTTPRLNMSDVNLSRDTFFYYLNDSEPEILKMLSYGYRADGNSSSSPFIKLLTNTFETFNTKDTVARTKEVGETFYGMKQMLPGSIVDSITGDDLSIRYKDYKNLPILKLHKAWFDYIEHVRRGKFAPSLEAITKRYIDYVSSIYYFLLDFDGETILYYCKYTGVAPISVPYSAFNIDVGTHDILEYDINYVYSFKEDMNPSILIDFNKVASGNALTHQFEMQNRSFIPTIEESLYSNDFLENGGKNSVLILKTYNNERPSFKLKFF